MAGYSSRTILGATGIWCAWPIGWTVAVILSLAFYKSGRWNDLEKVESGKRLSEKLKKGIDK